MREATAARAVERRMSRRPVNQEACRRRKLNAARARCPGSLVNVIAGAGPTAGQAAIANPGARPSSSWARPRPAGASPQPLRRTSCLGILELGCKSANIVFADADLDSAANAQVAGIFAAAGQSCVAGSRLIVERSVKDAFLARLKAKAEAARIGSPLDMATEIGPLATARQRDHVADLIARSLAAGARQITGGPVEGPGWYWRPTILDCDGTDAPALAEEFFGPVLSVVAFDTEAEALALANDTPFGLAAGVFTRDLARGHRMIRGVRAGVVWVNTYRAVSPIAPFGGHGLSGQGREGGMAAALDYTRTKTVWLRTSDDPIPDPFVMR